MNKGRGSFINPANPFLHEVRDSDLHEYWDQFGNRTRYVISTAKSIVNKIDSPDLKFKFSINPYQGCEHGCSYCYARNSHNYWGYSAGLDFESVILIKKNAPELLVQHFEKKSWIGEPVMMSGNTDCYQPLERKHHITRSLLKVFLKYKNPVGIISKNALMLKDLDLIEELAGESLLKVAISINTLDDALRRKLEPRASSIESRLELIEKLSNRNIPVRVLMAPIIPGINQHEIHSLVEEIANRGAIDAQYIVLRLNGSLSELFYNWLLETFPDRANKVMRQVSTLHGGRVSDSRFGIRMRGEGKFSAMIQQQYNLAMRKFMSGRSLPEFNRSSFTRRRNPQLKLF